MNDRINRACDDALAAIDRAMPPEQLDQGKPKVFAHQIYPAQRFDRDAIRTMLAEVIQEALTEDCWEVWRAGTKSLGKPGFDFLDDDIVIDRLLEWFGGKGAA